MKLLWLCNMVPGIAQKGNGIGGLWVDHVIDGLRQLPSMNIRILFPSKEERNEALDDGCSFASFQIKLPYEYIPELENRFEKELKDFQPDVVHIWGTEYAHTLAMVKSCEKLGLLDKTAINIQGLCSVIARHYTEGIPICVQKRVTFRDLVRQDNILQQQKKFVLRGENEIKALQLVRHVIGRTEWDKACTEQINPNLRYHFCNETLRHSFYNSHWAYEKCSRHSVFVSSCEYPVKGFHYILEAFGDVLRAYPDAKLIVPGKSFLSGSAAQKLRQNSYQKYLVELTQKYRLEDKIHFLGSLNEEKMRDAFLKANVFVLPSTSENSPNSLGEAMLLGVPCVASMVGGVSTMMEHNREGFLYQSTAPYMLAHYIKKVFAMEDKAAELGNVARLHAMKTHDPETNLNRLLEIYQELAENK